MIVPNITSVSREVLLAVPDAQREAALGLGATRWETTRMAVLRYGRSGIVGAIILGLGRALGETMAVTMVIGNRPEIALSLFAPGYTMASVIANEFTEATSDLYLSALVEIGLLLFVVTVARQRARPAPRLERRAAPREGDARVNAATRRRRIVNPAMNVPQPGLRPCWSCCPWSSILGFLVYQGDRPPSTWTSSPSCRSRSASRAAAWPTPSSAALILIGLAACVGLPIGILGRRLPRRVPRPAAAVARPLPRRRAERRAVDRHRHLRLHAGRAADAALLGAGRRAARSASS